MMIVKDIDKRNLAMDGKNFYNTSSTTFLYASKCEYDSSNTGFKVITNGYDKRWQFNNIVKDHYYFVYCELMVTQVNTLNRTIWTEGFDSIYTYTPTEANKWYTYKRKMKAIRGRYEAFGNGIRFYGGFIREQTSQYYLDGSLTAYYRNVVIVDMGTENFDIDTIDYRNYLNKSYIIKTNEVVGKNLFDYRVYFKQDSRFNIQGNEVSGLAGNFNDYFKYYIPKELIGKTLTFSCLVKSNDVTNIRVRFNNANGTIVNSNEYALSTITFIPASENDYIGITYGSGGNNLMYAKDFMLEQGSTATPYEPFKGYKSYVEADVYSILPDEYQEVMYLESTGTQYINTGIYATLSTSVSVIAKNNDTTPTARNLYGARTNATSANVCGSLSSAADRTIQLDFGDYSYTRTSSIVGTDRFEAYSSNVEASVNDYVKTYPYAYSTQFRTPSALYLFNAYNNFTQNMWIGHVYSFKASEGDTPVADFVPCIRKEDRKPGMYDLVTNTFKVNSGTGEFIAGPEVHRYR